MNRRNGVDTLADKNSPSMAWLEDDQKLICNVFRGERTMESTIMESTGKGVLYDSPLGSSALGIAGLSGVPAGPNPSSTSCVLLQREMKLGLC